MLEIIKNTILDGQTVVDGVVIAGYHAEVSTENPDAVQIQSWQFDVGKCLENIDLIAQESKEFAIAVKSLQQNIKEKND